MLSRIQLDRSGDRLLITEASGARVHLFQFSTGSALELLTIMSIADRPRFTAVSPDFTRLAAARSHPPG